MTTANVSTRAVLYLRMRSDHQEQSVPSQRIELTRYAGKHGYEIVREYIDEAISGDDTHKRAGFLAMRDDASNGSFDVVLCWDQDRFGRFDLIEGGYWIQPLREAQVRLETIAQGKIDWEDLVGQLIYSVNQMGKAQFLRDLSRNTTRGLLKYAREARSGTGGRTPYGYRVENGKVVIVESEADVIRWVFAECLKPGGSLRGIAGELNRRKVPPPNAARRIKKKTIGVWRDSSVRAILSRQKYTGAFVHGAQNGGRYHSMRDGEIIPRRKSDKSTEADPIIHEGRFEAIVDQETFGQVQAKLKGNKRQTTPRSAHQYLLAGLLKCGDCEGAMTGLRPSAPWYRCLTYHQSGCSACHKNEIDEAPLVSVIVSKIQDKYLSDTALNRLRRALEKEQERTALRPCDLKRLKAQIEKLNLKIDNAEDCCLEAPMNLRPGLYGKLQHPRIAPHSLPWHQHYHMGVAKWDLSLWLEDD